MMLSRRVTSVLAVAAAAACILGAVEPLYSGRTWHSYAEERRVIRAGILTFGAAPPSQYAMYLLGCDSVYVPLPGGQAFEFNPPRPPGWEIINPIATPGLDKSAAAYWAVGMGGIDMPLIQNFDVLLLPIVGGTVDLSIHQQRILERWVDQGGLLWIDNQPDHPNPGDDPQLGSFFLEPPLQFALRDRTVGAPKTSVDFTHPLLRGRYRLSEDEVELLGQQYIYGSVGDLTNTPMSPLDGITNGVNNPFPPNNGIAAFTPLQEVVGELYDAGGGTIARTPVIAAGYYGDGCIVAAACGVAAGISDWYAALSGGAALAATELPQWALPDIKFAYNMIQWWMDWSGTHGRIRSRGEYNEEVAWPPLITWQDLTILEGPLAGAAAVGRGLAFAGSYSGALAVWDTDPFADRDLDYWSDEGEPDYVAGSSQDLLWSLIVPWQDMADQDAVPAPPARVPSAADPLRPTPEELPRQVVGSPAVNTTYDGTGPRRVVAVAVRTEDNLDSSLHAFLADPLDGIQTDPVWSATIKRYDHARPEDDLGLVNSGPVAIDQFFALLTTDSGTLDAPNRDAHLLIYDASGPVTPDERFLDPPAASVKMGEGGRAASFTNPPAMVMTGAWDEVLRRTEAAPAAVITGNSLPRPGPSATGRLWVTPLMVRFPAPGWDRTWLVDPSQPDTAANQSVTVWVGDPAGTGVQVPPHIGDDPNRPLNYVRTTVGGHMRVVFTSWSLFGQGQYPLGFDQIHVRYRDTSGTSRSLSQPLHPGFPVSLGGYVSEAGYAVPCVFENNIYVGTDAVNAYPTPSSEGRVACYSLHLDRAGRPEWTFVGDKYRGQVPEDVNGTYFSSFSFTPAYAEETLFAAGNYEFFRNEEDQRNESLPEGPSGMLYALELKASPELVNPGTADPVFAAPIDAIAPRNNGVNPGPFSADPNQVVVADRTGAAVWISTRTDPTDPAYNSPRYAVPQVAGATMNWTVDFQNSIIRLGSGVFGSLACPVWSDMGTPGDVTDDRYLPQQVRVRYFSGGVLVDTVMEVTPLVKWLYLAPDGWQFVGPPVVTNGMLMVVVYDHALERYLLIGFRAVPEDPTVDDPLWAHPSEPEYVKVLVTGVGSAQLCSLAVTERGVVWSTTLGSFGGVVGLGTPETIIADNHRLLAADPAGRSATSQESVSYLDPSRATGAAGIPVSDSYPERRFEPVERPQRVRALPNGNLLVVDTGASCVVELDAGGDVVWRYPSGEQADLGGMNEEQARLLAPTDAHRYYYRPESPASGADFADPRGIIQPTDDVVVDWVSTLIADAGNYRVLEVVRPLLNGRYRPEVTDVATATPYMDIVRVLASPTLTAWPTAAGGTTSAQAQFVTADRFVGVDGAAAMVDATYPFLSANIMCAVGNSPDDPLGGDRYTRLVEIGVTYDAAGRVSTSTALPRLDGVGNPEGINVFRPRSSPWTAADAEQSERDFFGIRQADQVVQQDEATGLPLLRTMVVDDVGVKLIDSATWNDAATDYYLTPVFEMRGVAPWLHDPGLERPGDFLTTYEEEIVGGDYEGLQILGLAMALVNWVGEFGDPAASGIYPPLISEPRTGFTPAEWDALRAAAFQNIRRYVQATAVRGAAAAEVPFAPVFATWQRDGRCLIVNGYPDPYLSTGPLDVMAPVTSEVFEVDPSQPLGQRIVDSWDEELGDWQPYMWSHFIVPDPGRSEYPALRGGAGPLRQPRAVDRR
ncbi:MAG: hypothetical protein JSV65_17055 [Armatimonadota bacterium]|nr:MAG: hypothetical protein JSV65_17055 [Armatimonadota bacterium]